MSEAVKHRAWVSISSHTLAELLGLPEGTEILRADTNGMDFGVRFGMQGDTLPAVDERCVAPDIMMILYQEIEHGVRSLYGSWSHDPDKRWLIRRQLESDFNVVYFPLKQATPP